jgi:MoxR-like ATPase
MHFVEDRAGHFIGRQELSDALFTHADTGYTADSLPLVVVGAPGSGKTSLVAAFAKRCVFPPESVLIPRLVLLPCGSGVVFLSLR